MIIRMGKKRFHRSVFLRLTLIIALTVAATWLLFVQKAVVAGMLVVPVIAAAVWNLISYFNNLNRWMSNFLLGIENEDATLKIPEKSGNQTIDDVYKGINRLNEIFRQTKREIHSQEQYYRMVINQSGTGLFSVNENGRVINVNPAATALTQLNEHHHINALKSIDASLPGLIMKRETKQDRQSVIFPNRHGQKLLFKFSEITIKGETVKLVAVSDITKELDSREVDAWIKLARTLSHEIMNNIVPITTLSQVISGYFVRNHTPVNPAEVNAGTISNTIKGLTVIEERSKGLMNFVENYRKFTKLPEPQLSETNLTALIGNNLIAASAFPDFGRITIQKSIPENLMVITDEKLLSQVLTNIFKNASQALADSTTANPTLWIKVTNTDNGVTIAIQNNGPAIPAEQREQIFVPFFTTREEGSGIGLSLSKQIMLSMGGDIVLTPEKNDRLTTFSITLRQSP